MPEEVIGKTFRQYTVLRKLGQGGMGDVYLARDTALDRDVALKFLSDEMRNFPSAHKRLLREAKAAAGLTHPSICQVYEIGKSGDKHFIAMEYIAGQSLGEELSGGPLPVERTIEIAVSAVEALDEAHEKGIVHRDLKPGNIMLTRKGHVKVVDFGLAKPLRQTGTQDETADMTLTMVGSTIGTPSYMSPEQARGDPIDGGTDTFSLGIVLYESLAGVNPFRRRTPIDTISAILSEDPPPLSQYRNDIPPRLEEIILKMLAKSAENRYTSPKALLQDLKQLRDARQKAEGSSSRQPFYRTWKALALATSLIGLIAVALLFRPFLSQPGKEGGTAPKLTPLTMAGGLAAYPAWSPDGEWIVFSSDNGSLDLYKVPLNGGATVRLTETPFNEEHPEWSPDGKKIAFSSDEGGGGVFIMDDQKGGNRWRLTDFGSGPTWSPDGEKLAFESKGDVYLVSSKGGDKPRLLLSGTTGSPYPVWLPDGESLIIWNRRVGDLCRVSVQDGSTSPIGLIPAGYEVSGLTWLEAENLLIYSAGPFGGDNNLWSVTLDPSTLAPLDPPHTLSVSVTDDVECSVSPVGDKLAFTARQTERQLWNIDLDPATGLPKSEPQQLTQLGVQNYYPALSRDGSRLLWTSHQTGRGMLFYKSFDEAVERKVTGEWGREVREAGGSFSPDGSQISYGSTLNKTYEVWKIPPLEGLRLTQTEHPSRDTMTTWSPLGDLIFFYSNRTKNWDIWSVSASESQPPSQITTWESNEMYPSCSPDGRYIAFTSDREGTADIWSLKLEDLSCRPEFVAPSTEAWSEWSSDGKWLYFSSDRSGVFNVWRKPVQEGDAEQVTSFEGLTFGLPTVPLYTKFALSRDRLILPLEKRRGDIYLLENLR